MCFQRSPIPLSFIGFSFFLLLEIVSFYSGTLFSPLKNFRGDLSATYWVTLIGTRIFIATFITVLALKRTSFSFSRTPFMLVCSLVALIGLALTAFGITTSNFPCIIFGAFLFGSAQGTTGLLWLYSLSFFTYRGSYLSLILSHALATLLCAVLIALPPSSFLLCSLGFLLMGNLLLTRMPLPKKEHYPLSSQARIMLPLLSKGILSVCLFAFASGIMRTFSTYTLDALDPLPLQYLTLAVSGIVLIIMLTPALIQQQPLHLENSYRVALPLSALGFLVLPGVSDLIPSSLAGILTTSGYMLTGIVLICTVIEIAKNAKMPALPLLSSTEAFTLLFLLAGIASGNFLAHYFTDTVSNLILIGAGSLYLVVVLSSWVFSRNKNKPLQHLLQNPRKNMHPANLLKKTSTDTSPLLPSDPLQKDLLESIAHNQNLTEQERTILIQLLKGRTIPRIAQDLFLSTGSVKYHVQKLYRLFGVHSRHELVDAILQMQENER